MCLLNFSVYQSACLSKSLYMPVRLYVSLSLPLSHPPISLPLSLSLSLSLSFSLSLSLSFSLSKSDVGLADQGSRARYRAIQVFSWDSKSVPCPINFSWLKPIILIMYHLSVTTTWADPESFVREGLTLTTFF